MAVRSVEKNVVRAEEGLTMWANERFVAGSGITPPAKYSK